VERERERRVRFSSAAFVRTYTVYVADRLSPCLDIGRSASPGAFEYLMRDRGKQAYIAVR